MAGRKSKYFSSITQIGTFPAPKQSSRKRTRRYHSFAQLQVLSAQKKLPPDGIIRYRPAAAAKNLSKRQSFPFAGQMALHHLISSSTC